MVKNSHGLVVGISTSDHLDDFLWKHDLCKMPSFRSQLNLISTFRSFEDFVFCCFVEWLSLKATRMNTLTWKTKQQFWVHQNARQFGWSRIGIVCGLSCRSGDFLLHRWYHRIIPRIMFFPSNPIGFLTCLESLEKWWHLVVKQKPYNIKIIYARYIYIYKYLYIYTYIISGCFQK